MADTTALKNRIRAAIKANDNQEITGPVLQQSLLDIVDELDLSSELENEVQQRRDGDTQLNNLITGIKNNIDNGYVYAGIAIPSTVPVSGKVFYVAIQAGTYTNFGDMAVTQGINILKYNGSVWSKDVIIGIDDTPTQGSDNLVKSGGVHQEARKFVETSNTTEADLDISDENNNVLIRLENGHIKTKNFDSSNINPEPTPIVTNRTKLSYLAIGNSVNQDVVAYLPYLLRKIYGNNIDFEIGLFYIGSYTIKDYVELVITKQTKSAMYSYTSNSETWTNKGSFYLEDCLKSKNWNVITFQMYQTDLAGTGHAEDVTLSPQLLSYLKDNSNPDCKFGIVTPATYTDVREKYIEWQEYILTHCSLDFLIDYGATKEFLNNRGIDNSFLCNDGYHSDEGFPCTVLSLTAVHILSDLLKFEDKASNFKERITQAECNSLNIPGKSSTFVTATEAQWKIGVDSAVDGGRVSKVSYALSNQTLRTQTFNND